ncbi:hypothetical protein INR49_023987 [Caranx melampygus]|nr:hypothetical protein INR49_023987 [Caranx melampygus]
MAFGGNRPKPGQADVPQELCGVAQHQTGHRFHTEEEEEEEDRDVEGWRRDRCSCANQTQLSSNDFYLGNPAANSHPCWHPALFIKAEESAAVSLLPISTFDISQSEAFKVWTFKVGAGPSLYKVNSRSPSGSSPILSGPGHHYIVASLCSEQKRRLLCAHIKGGLSNLGLAMCWWSESLEQPRRSYLSPTDSFCFLLQHNWLLVTLTHACMALHVVHGEGFALVPSEPVPTPCNDKVVEKLSRLAVTYINEDRDDGYKFALNRIANVHLHAQQISGNCNTTILHTPDGYSYLYSYDCTLVPDPPEKLQRICPTCPLLLRAGSPKAMSAAQVTLASYKRKSRLGAGLGVKRITRAAEQVVPVKATFVEYTVQQCPEGVTERGTCQRLTLNSDTETAGFCAGSVHGDINAHADVRVSCEMFKVQNVDILRPLQPQVHDLTPDPVSPTFPAPIDDPASDPQPGPSDPEPVPSDPEPVPSDPTSFPAVQPAPFDPSLIQPEPFDPSVVVNPSNPLTSSSSESFEGLINQQQPPPVTGSFDSSSEEVGGPLALRPPFNFRYQKHDRKKRQALTQTSPTHNPVFLSDFPELRASGQLEL